MHWYNRKSLHWVSLIELESLFQCLGVINMTEELNSVSVDQNVKIVK